MRHLRVIRIGSMDKRLDGQTYRQMYRETDGRTDGQMDGRTDGWMDRQTDGRMDKRMDGLTEGQTLLQMCDEASHKIHEISFICCVQATQHHAVSVGRRD